MKWSLYLGKISGIKISIHWTFLILILWLIQYHVFKGHGLAETLRAFAFLIAIFACITLHELGHALTAKRYNFKTREIILLPIGGLARMEGLPEKPVQEFIVAVMGPVVNIVIALLLFLVLKLSNTFAAPPPDLNISGVNFWRHLYNVNLILALFNLLPAFPMDGGRVFRALLSIRLPRMQATRIAVYIGQIMAIVFVFLGFTSSPMLIFIGLFIFLGAQAEMNAEAAKVTLSGIKVSDVLMHRYSVLSPQDTLSKAVSLLLDSQEKFFVIQENNEVKGTLSRKNIVSGLVNHGADTRLTEVMNKEVKSFQAEALLRDVLLSISGQGEDTMFPVYSGNQLVGIVNLENIQEYLMVKEAVLRHPDNNNTLDVEYKFNG